MKKISVITSLYRCEKYLDTYFSSVNQISNLNECEFILLHNDPIKSEIDIIDSKIIGKPYFRYYSIKREPLYSSWNRGISLANGIYIAIWNVDDVRLPNSLDKQAQILDKYNDIAMTYGDTISIARIGDKEGKLQFQKPYNEKTKNEFLKTHYIGCFQMWRKSIHKLVGYYDEQYKMVGDYEFQIRVAYNLPLKKTEEVLGFYFHGGDGTRLSQQLKIQHAERASVFIRYGIFIKLDLTYFLKGLKYNINSITEFGDQIALNKYVKISINRYLKFILQIPINLFTHFPFDFLRYIKIYLFKIPTKVN